MWHPRHYCTLSKWRRVFAFRMGAIHYRPSSIIQGFLFLWQWNSKNLGKPITVWKYPKGFNSSFISRLLLPWVSLGIIEFSILAIFHPLYASPRTALLLRTWTASAWWKAVKINGSFSWALKTWFWSFFYQMLISQFSTVIRDAGRWSRLWHVIPGGDIMLIV